MPPAPGTPITTIITDHAKALGINVGNLAATLATQGPAAVFKQFTKGFTAHGRAAPQLDLLLKSIGLEWSIQDGALQLLKPGGVNPNAAEVLSAATGLLDSPEHGTPEAVGKPAYLKVKCLLRANLRPGSAIQLDSLFTRGNFRAITVEHEGDTAGGPWETRVEALPLL